MVKKPSSPFPGRTDETQQAAWEKEEYFLDFSRTVIPEGRGRRGRRRRRKKKVASFSVTGSAKRKRRPLWIFYAESSYFFFSFEGRKSPFLNREGKIYKVQLFFSTWFEKEEKLLKEQKRAKKTWWFKQDTRGDERNKVMILGLAGRKKKKVNTKKILQRNWF